MNMVRTRKAPIENPVKARKLEATLRLHEPACRAAADQLFAAARGLRVVRATVWVEKLVSADTADAASALAETEMVLAQIGTITTISHSMTTVDAAEMSGLEPDTEFEVVEVGAKAGSN